jgi:hypothetical protein
VDSFVCTTNRSLLVISKDTDVRPVLGVSKYELVTLAGQKLGKLSNRIEHALVSADEQVTRRVKTQGVSAQGRDLDIESRSW